MIEPLEGLKNIKMSNEEEGAINDAIYWLSHPFEMLALQDANNSLIEYEMNPSKTEICELSDQLDGYYQNCLNKDLTDDKVIFPYIENLKKQL